MIWIAAYLLAGWCVFGVGCAMDRSPLNPPWPMFFLFSALTMLLWLPLLCVYAVIGVWAFCERV